MEYTGKKVAAQHSVHLTGGILGKISRIPPKVALLVMVSPSPIPGK